MPKLKKSRKAVQSPPREGLSKVKKIRLKLPHGRAKQSARSEGDLADPTVAIRTLCENLAAAGMTQTRALEALMLLWPTDTNNLESVSRCIVVGEKAFPLDDEFALTKDSVYFERLLSGPFRERSNIVLDLSEVPIISDRPEAFGHFLSLTTSRGSDPLDSLSIPMVVDLLELSEFFVASRHCGLCVARLVKERNGLLTEGAQVVSRIPWRHFEKILSSCGEQLDIIRLAAVWSKVPREDELSKLLHNRCPQWDSMGVGTVLDICSTSPHILSMLPEEPARRFFSYLKLSTDWLETGGELCETLLDAVLPNIEKRHVGQYTNVNLHTGGGWSCCGARKLRTAGCQNVVERGYDTDLDIPGVVVPGALSVSIQDELKKLEASYFKKLSESLTLD